VRPKTEAERDDDVRKIFISLITFVAACKASDSAKNQALDDIQKLQGRLLP
jgi:hypothetical protein